MTIDSVITLNDSTNYLLLEKVENNNSNFFLAVLLNEEEEPTEEYVIFKEVVDNTDRYVEIVNDSALVDELLKGFEMNVSSLIENLK